MNYEQWGTDGYGNDGYGEAPMPGGYTPSSGVQNENFAPGTQEMRIPAPQSSINDDTLNNARSLLGLSAPPASGRRPVARPGQAPQGDGGRSKWVVPVVLAGGLGLAYWFWWRK